MVMLVMEHKLVQLVFFTIKRSRWITAFASLCKKIHHNLLTLYEPSNIYCND